MTITNERKLGSDTAFNVVGIAVLVAFMVSSLYPFLWAILNSFRTNDEMILHPLRFPLKLDFGVFVEAWHRTDFNHAFLNSVVNSASAVGLVLLTGSLAAYPLARMRFFGNGFIVKFLMVSIIISGQLILIPLFYVMKGLGVYNSLLSTILANTAMALPICIYLFYGFFREIPREIEESTMIDGCNRWTFYFRFIIPLSKPILSTVAIFVALWSWNEYLFALTFLKEQTIRTIPLQLQIFFGRWSTEYGLLFAALSISIVPILAIYIAMQKAFIKGLTAGAVKI
jgi:raffinose/stachyose/melibiose transport system permease protein